MVLDFDAEAKWSRFIQNKANQTHHFSLSIMGEIENEYSLLSSKKYS